MSEYPLSDPPVEASVESAVETDDQTSRDAMPVADTPPPRLAFPVVGIGASAGGLEAFTEFFDAMPSDRGLAFVLVQHLSPKHESMVAEILQKHTQMPVHQVEDGMHVEPDHVYVIRPGHTMTIKDGRLHLGESLLKAGHSRPVDDFFKSLAEEQRERAICIILSGMGSNGTAGAQAIKVAGGMGIAQEPNSAKFPSMPRSMVESNIADFILKPAEMPEVLLRYTNHAYTRDEAPADLISRSESHQINDILAILRARVRHDFSGYKRPTIVRRIQRRMSLTQNTSMTDYARLLRQTPAEVVNLSDDLMIHVTGFFRDAEVWDVLRERIITPMVAEKPDQASIRVWVTACATGEEAYTLAMLLVEAAEKVDKQFDIKVFATDMAERALNHARAGIFPGGIESDVAPERLARFFDKDESMYRVKKHLRELVVFAPQNVLQDPPFSRLDIATCRNLLIYLEPAVQLRVLSLLHFGLREGGVLVLGNSETVGEYGDELFEPIDKKVRIYRRIGPTRHGMINFPARYVSPTADAILADAERPLSRANLSQATGKALLEHHSPPSVVVDRHGRVAYFHGETRLFLDQPSGEPTRDVLELAMNFVRGPIRVALHNAIETGKLSVSKDGVLDIDGIPHRIEVHAMPVEQRSLQGYYLVSFVHYPISQMVVKSDADDAEGDASAQDEVRALRDELQSTIEELQTSNEEMKASHEEVTSVNEELQSTNEELETSKEELQSLNEELTTVNAQLEAKMDELESISNDLTSLLASSDTAVIFLDRQFRIRRFTPATKPLIDLIAADVGRPLSDFARKFHDPKLMDAARNVLTTLVPEQATITGDAGRWYIRRLLPYRTTDDRIDGVVINFLDITEIKRAEAALRLTEERLRTMADAAPVLIWQTDETGLTFCNRHYLAFFGRPFDAMAGMGWAEFLQPDDATNYLATYRAAFAGQQTYEYECRFRRHDGEYRWLQNSGTPHHGPDGTFLGFIGCSMDVTDRKGAEERQIFLLKLSDALRPLDDAVEIEFEATRVLGEHLGVGRVFYAEAEPDGDHLVIHRSYTVPDTASFLGRIRLSDFGSFWVEGYRAGRTLATSDVRTIEGAQAAAFEAAGIRACIGVPVNKGGRLVGVLVVHSATSRNWTQLEISLVEATAERTWTAVVRARAETLLRDNESRLRTLLDNVRDFAILTMDARGVITQWSPGATEILGWTAEETIGQPGEIIFTDEDRAAGAPEEEMQTALRDGRAPDERWHRRKDGSRFWASGVMSAVRDGDGESRGFVKILRDATGRRLADTDRAAILEGEQHARNAAEAANTSKDQFLANLSHELRTPLSAMLMWSKVLQDQPDAAIVAEGLIALEHSARAQQKLIDDLLDSARIATGKMNLELKPVDLGQVVRDAAAATRYTIDAKGIELHIDLGETVGVVMVDAERLQQVIWNLINNAVKFTPAGGRIDVGVRRRDGTIEIRIADTGQGIDAELLAQIFERFRQGDPSRTRRFGGLGLGLSISRQIVELHGGTIEAASDGPGRGTTFTISLPLPRTKSTARPPAVTEELRDVKIVLVEDDAQLRDVVSMVLQRAGARVEAFDMADPAKQSLLADSPDILLCDIGLPDKDGYALIREFREQENTGRHLPSIAFTAFDRPQDRVHALECGFDEHLAKPVDPTRLIQVIRTMLQTSQL